MRLPTALLAAVVVCGACAHDTAPTAASPTEASATIAPAAVASSTGAAVLAPVAPPAALLNGGGTWYLLPDGLSQEGIRLNVEFPEGDPSGGRPRARLGSTGRTVDLVPSGPPVKPGATGPAPHWIGTLSLDGATPGRDVYEVLVQLRNGTDAVVAERPILISEPEYVVWTLDFEGDATSDETMDNTLQIARTHGVPMTVMWNPRVWTTTQVTAARADAMVQWLMDAQKAGIAEVALHLHAWTDFVRDAGVAPRTAPNWAARSDGYDVPLTAFDETETGKLLDRALALMAQHGMPRPSSFRGGGLFANAANLRAVAAAGFTVDSSATPAGPFGKLLLPWTLPKDAQPYRPSPVDANRPGDLRLLEVPNIAGNTFSLTVNTIQSTIRDDLAMLAPPTQVATTRKALTLVSHPGTIDATERAAIEALFKAFEPYRYDKGNGPLRFVTLAQLGAAYK
jgi:hypothetical protein